MSKGDVKPGYGRKACVSVSHLKENWDHCLNPKLHGSQAQVSALMAQLDVQHQTLTQTRARPERWPSAAVFACHRQRNKKKKCPSRGACLPSGRACFLSVTKPRLPESVKELRDHPTPHPNTSSSFQNHHDKLGKVSATTEVSRLQDDFFSWILNKNLEAGSYKTWKKCYDCN